MVDVAVDEAIPPPTVGDSVDVPTGSGVFVDEIPEVGVAVPVLPLFEGVAVRVEVRVEVTTAVNDGEGVNVP